MSENKPLIDAETREKLKERGGALQGGITELSDDQVDAVAGGKDDSQSVDKTPPEICDHCGNDEFSVHHTVHYSLYRCTTCNLVYIR